MLQRAIPILILVLLALSGCTIRTSSDPVAVAIAQQMFQEMHLTR